ncbi:MAG: hypothetical protein U0324_01100 [Polyangiales bacterium]
MKHETHGPTKINGAAAPRGLDGAQRRSGWSEEDERRATDPYVAPQGGRTEARQGWPEHEQKAPAQSDRRMNETYDARQRRDGDPARATGGYESAPFRRDEDRSPDATQRQKPYIVEAMAPPSVPPMAPDRSGIPDDARTDLAPSDDVPRPQDPNEFGAHGDLPPDAGH